MKPCCLLIRMLMKELSILPLCGSQVVQLLLSSIYGILERLTFYFLHLSSAANQPSKKSEKKKEYLPMKFYLSPLHNRCHWY